MPPVSGIETIFVVDDESLVLSIANAMLTQYGYTAITAASGTDAIRFFENWPDVQVDLLLVDLKLPDLDGAEAVKRIHELRLTCQCCTFQPIPRMSFLGQ